MTYEAQFFEYLKSVNPISQKIGEDVEKITKRHQNKWNSLDGKSKEKLLDQALIDENLVQKYKKYGEQESNLDYSSRSNFSWFTKSQLNLFTAFDPKPAPLSATLLKKRQPHDVTVVTSPSSRKSKPSESNTASSVTSQRRTPAPPKPTTTNTTPKDDPSKTCPKKPKTPPPPPPSKLVVTTQPKSVANQGGLSPNDPDIPKTGFDFLDNW